MKSSRSVRTPDDLIASDPPPAFPPWMVAADPRLAAEETNRFFLLKRRWSMYTPPMRRLRQIITGINDTVAVELIGCVGLFVFLLGPLVVLGIGGLAAGLLATTAGLWVVALLLHLYRRSRRLQAPASSGDSGRIPLVGLSMLDPRAVAQPTPATLLFLWIVGARGSELIELRQLELAASSRLGVPGWGLVMLGCLLAWVFSQHGADFDQLLLLTPMIATWLLSLWFSRKAAIRFLSSLDIMERWVEKWEDAARDHGGRGPQRKGDVAWAVASIPAGAILCFGTLALVAYTSLNSPRWVLSLALALPVALVGFVFVPLMVWRATRNQSTSRLDDLRRRADAAFEFVLGQLLNPGDPDEVRALLIRQGKLGLDDPWPPLATPGPSTTTPPPPPPPG